MPTYWYSGSGSTTTTATSVLVWGTWCNATTATTSYLSTATTSSTTWMTWCNGVVQSSSGPSVRELTQAERAHNAKIAEDLATRNKELERLRNEAEARAEKLLLENLDLQQRLDYEKSKSFVVHGRAGWRFRIRAGRMGNVDAIDKSGKVKHRLCAHPNVMLPNCDTMLAQKLLLEDNQDSFMRIANKHAVINPETQVLEAVE